MMNTHDLYDQRDSFYLKPSANLRGAMVLLVLLGIVTVGAGVTFAEPSRVWGALLFNLFFFYSIALGGIAFGGMQDIIGAVWGRPIKRLHESFAAFLPVSSALFALFLVCIVIHQFGAQNVYSWIRDPRLIAEYPGKNFWLQPGFMVVRDIAALIVILALSTWQMGYSLRRDRAFVAGKRDQAIELAILARKKLQYWCGPILVCYSLLFSLLSFDLLQSLAPTWYSTLWAGWLFSIMMQTLMAALLVLMFAVKNSPIGQVIGRQQFHDVGKLMHGFTVFFAYLTFAHILTHWYGNIPEETSFYLHRLEKPWLYLVIAAPIMSFVIPFFALIFKSAKWTSILTIPICLVILFSQWLADLLIVTPEVTSGSQWNLPWVEVGIFFGIFGLFLMSIVWFGRRYPMVGLADPLLPEALQGGHH